MTSFIYILEMNGFYKIGITKNTENRFRTYSTHSPYKIKKVFVARVKRALQIETILHKRYKTKRVKGEWFSLSKNDISEIRSYVFPHMTSVLEQIECKQNL